MACQGPGLIAGALGSSCVGLVEREPQRSVAAVLHIPAARTHELPPRSAAQGLQALADTTDQGSPR